MSLSKKKEEQEELAAALFGSSLSESTVLEDVACTASGATHAVCRCNVCQ